MRTVLFLLEKEFRQIFRNKGLLPIIFVMPIIQLLILPLAADYEVKNIQIALVDHDQSPYSLRLVSSITASGYFKPAYEGESYQTALELVEKDKADLILEIPRNFERNLIRENKEKLFIAVNAINGTKAALGGAYLNRIISDFNSEIRTEWREPARLNPMPLIDITHSNWYNPQMNYNFFMVPGILAILVTMIAGYLSALNIVREKENGTIEQINVTPIKKHHFIIGKLIPFWVLGILMFSIGLGLIARLVYQIVPLGSLFVLYSFLSVYLLAILGFGLLISTYAEKQQQAMSIAFFFVMIFMLMSGLFTPVNSMSDWARFIALFNPVTWFIEVMRMIMLKGSSFYDLRGHFAVICGFAVVLNGWAVLNYKKRG